MAMPFVELHFHLLPAVDDGPRTTEESLALAVAATADGTRTVVCTPHVNETYATDPLDIPDRVAELSGRLKRERIKLTVLPGGELAHQMVERLSDAQLGAIAHGPAGRRWVLLEAPFSGLDDSFTAAADELRHRGFAAVVAHPERSARARANDAALGHELAAGSVLQVNAWSLAGLNGEEIRRSALELVRRTGHAVIASDAHSQSRMPALGLGLDALAAAGIRDPSRLAETIPRALLDHGLVIRESAVAA
jgi:protein-tyrosine phosphatase